MAVNNLLDTSTENLNGIVGNGKTYTVPAFQRDYSWKRDQWEDLWNDIVAIAENEQVHYMGSVVLQNMGNKQYRVIDGQQRFTTFTLIVLAIIKHLQYLIDRGIDTEDNKERVEILKRKFIGDRDPGSLTYFAKLRLNENNDSFFQTNLLTFRPPVNEAILKDSDKLLWRAYNFFVDIVSNFFKDEAKGQVITDFLDKVVAERLMFIQIVVEDELSAYTVFETLNSRGVGLTVTDLLKNYLFSIATEADLPHIRNRWKGVIDIVGLDNFSTFLRHYWLSKERLVRQEYLFRAIKEKVRDSQGVIDLLEALEKNALLYNALSNYADKFWAGHRQTKRYVKELILFREKQAYSLLIAAYDKLSQDEFAKVLKIVAVITFRYTVIAKLHTNQKEEIYSKVAIKISNGETQSAFQIAQLVKPLYPTDSDFRNDFSTKIISTKRGKKLVRYILYALENYAAHTTYDFEENSGTIEHILPESGNTNYEDEFSTSVHESMVYRLGNYTILEEAKNKQCENLPFDDKKEVYKTSNYKLTQSIQESTWTPNTLDLRQDKMAEMAKTIWRISQFDQESSK